MDDPENSAERVREAVSRYERPLFSYALRMVGGDAERAADVVQETFAKLVAAAASGNGHSPTAGLPQWLYTVCRNAALDVRRKEKRTMSLIDATADGIASTGAGPDESAERKDSTTRV